MDKLKSIKGILKSLENTTLISIWNEYCSNENMEDYIYENEEYTINEIYANNADEALRAAYYGEYRYCDEYFIINAYGNLTSFDAYNVEQHIDFDTLAEYIADNGCDEINEVWLEDVIYDFVTYYNETHNPTIDEDYNFNTFDLIRGDWEEIAEEISETL